MQFRRLFWLTWENNILFKQKEEAANIIILIHMQGDGIETFECWDAAWNGGSGGVGRAEIMAAEEGGACDVGGGEVRAAEIHILNNFRFRECSNVILNYLDVFGSVRFPCVFLIPTIDVGIP